MKIKNLTFAFKGHKKPFFNNVTISLQTGKLTALCGQNGTGKSTLLKILSGHLTGECLKGTISFDNNTSYTAHNNHFPKDCMRTIQLVQQDIESMLAPQYTAQQNLQFARMPEHPSLTHLPVIDTETVQATLPFELKTPVHELSGGQRQLLTIAMALQQNPKILLLDEPTAALDNRNAHLVMRTLQQLVKRTNTIVLIVCHNPELVNEYADECINHIK